MTTANTGEILTRLGTAIAAALLNAILGSGSQAASPAPEAEPLREGIRGSGLLIGVVVPLPGSHPAHSISGPAAGTPNDAPLGATIPGPAREAAAGSVHAHPREPFSSGYAGGVDYLDRMVDEDPGLATLDDVRRSIFEVEKVRVVLVHPALNEIHPDKRGFIPYPYRRKIPNDTSVSAFVAQRLAPLYERHGLRAVVQNPEGGTVAGETKIREVREAFDR